MQQLETIAEILETKQDIQIIILQNKRRTSVVTIQICPLACMCLTVILLPLCMHNMA